MSFRLPLSLLCAMLTSTAFAADLPARLTPAEILARVTRATVAHYSLEGDLVLEPLRAIPVPAGAAAVWEVRVLDFPATLTGALLVHCQLLGDGQPVGETTLVLHAALWRDAWSSRAALAAGASFDPALFAVQRVDFLRERETLPASTGDSNYVLARAVSPGRLLTWRDVARRPLVHKGDLIEVTAVDGALSVTLQAQALESGAAGDSVAIRNLDSKKTFTAIVTDEKRAQLRL